MCVCILKTAVLSPFGGEYLRLSAGWNKKKKKNFQQQTKSSLWLRLTRETCTGTCLCCSIFRIFISVASAFFLYKSKFAFNLFHIGICAGESKQQKCWCVSLSSIRKNRHTFSCSSLLSVCSVLTAWFFQSNQLSVQFLMTDQFFSDWSTWPSRATAPPACPTKLSANVRKAWFAKRWGLLPCL